MPRKRPFSAKQKKKQLQDKRERKRQGFQDGVRSSSNSRSGSHDRHEEHTDTSDSESFSLQVRKLNQQPQIRKPGERGYDPNRYRLHFERESREEVERRKKIAREKILEPVSEKETEVDIEDVYKTGSDVEAAMAGPGDVRHRVAYYRHPTSVFKKRRKRRKGWSTAMGPNQLLSSCETITAGKVDLSSWKEKIERDAAGAGLLLDDSEEDEEDDRSMTVLVEHQTDVAMEGGGISQELYKDGILTVGCVGFPNVGKSSLINGLVGRKVVSVSRTPGHTKYFQTYFLTPTVKLCDCPGLIFPSLVDKKQQILAGIYPISQIQEPYTPVGYLASRIPVQALLKLRHPDAEHGKPEPPWCAWDVCEAWAEKRGYKTAKGARNDVYRAANSLLRLAVDGRLCICMRPPGYTSQKGMWDHHPETAEIAALQEAHRQEDKQGSAEENEWEEEEEDEISSSGEEEDEEKDRDADEEGEEEEEPLSAPKSGPSQSAPPRKGKLPTQNLFALLGEDEC
ncbi:guanine nucleotide-binding protein-like 1 isoform X2 [Ahaetulla prasina]|uniref:guanine nucleotide-binding protein-like 1 isoform X2 n=1 Tax=Ahaetulla prasina TaxID=499056 RepID=UPI00264991BD|nr:guanine nucleotide-binding protein-like 1 isoform X2 [Ahaetulla prasina]